jgi:hypothetical protein
VESFFLWVIMGKIRSRTAAIKKPSDMGREMKVEKSPLDMMSD